MPRRGRRHPSGRRRNGTSLGEGSRLELRVGEAFDEALKRPLRAAMKTSSPSAASASSLLLASSPSTSTSSAFSSPAAALSASASFGNACISWRRARSWTMVADIPKSVPRRVDASATLRAVPRRRKKEGEETAPTATATPLRPNNNLFRLPSFPLGRSDDRSPPLGIMGQRLGDLCLLQRQARRNREPPKRKRKRKRKRGSSGERRRRRAGGPKQRLAADPGRRCGLARALRRRQEARAR